MKNINIWTLSVASVLLLLLLYGAFAVPQVESMSIPSGPEAIARGEYLVAAGGCVSCHEGADDPSSLTGGLGLESEFGTFYVPNITPHVGTGIGDWSAQDFLLAIKHGRSPDGSFYFPAFPYRSYAGMTNEDVLDIAAYLLSQPSVEAPEKAHETPVWLFRWMMAAWNGLADILQPTPELPVDTEQRRGAYLARNLGHCGECHTPRNALGMSELKQEFAGATVGENHFEALTREALSGWTEEDFTFLLFLGLKPDGEYVGGEMEPVIEHNTSRLTDEDRKALAAFFIR